MTSAREGDVAEAGVEQVRVNAGIGMDEHALGDEALGTVAGDGITMIEVAMLAGVELYLPVVVQAGGEAATGMDHLYDGKAKTASGHSLPEWRTRQHTRPED